MKRQGNIYIGMVAVLLLLIWAPQKAQAQKWAASTNALSWISLGTINAEGAISIDQHFSVNAGIVANPWTFTSPTYVELKNQQYGGYIGAKYWPWHVYTEWWIGAKLQYKYYQHQGLLTSQLAKGHALGAGLSAGYSMMITDHFNLDFGLGLWGGRLIGNKRNFIFVDNVMVSLAYIF